jgi:hypothetical protein
MVALSASRLVCSAMLEMTLTTSPISREESPSLITVELVVSAAATARPTTCAASLALCEISRMEAPISSAPAATVCTFRETSSAAPATTLACAEDSSLSAAIRRDTPPTRSLVATSSPALRATSAIASPSRASALLA